MNHNSDILSNRTKFYKKLPNNIVEAWNTISDIYGDNSTDEFKEYFSFFFPKRLFKFLNISNILSKFDSVISNIKKIREFPTPIIYIYYALINVDKTVLSLESIILTLLKFDYTLLDSILEIFTIGELVSIPKLPKFRLEKLRTIPKRYKNIILRIAQEEADEFIPFPVYSSNMPQREVYEIVRLFAFFHNRSAIESFFFKDYTNSIIAILACGYSSLQDVSDLVNYLNFCKYGFCENIHDTTLRNVRNMFNPTDIPITNVMISLLYNSEFDASTFAKTIREEKIYREHNLEIDPKKLYEIGADVHENDGMCNEIIEEFIEVNMNGIVKKEYNSFLQKFWDGLRKFKEEEPEKYSLAILAIGYDENLNKIDSGGDSWPGLLTSISKNSTFTLTNFEHRDVRHKTLDFIVSMVKFCETFEVDTSSFPPLEMENMIRKEREQAMKSIYYGFYTAFDKTHDYVVCDWGKCTHLIASLLSGRFVLKNGFNCNVSVSEEEYLKRYKNVNSNDVSNNYYTVRGDVMLYENDSNFISFPNPTNHENLYDTYKILSKYTQKITGETTQSEKFFEGLFLRLKTLFLEGDYYDTSIISKLIFCFYKNDEVKIKVDIDGKEVKIPCLDFSNINSFAAWNFPSHYARDYMLRYYKKDAIEFYKNNPQIVQEKRDLVDRKAKSAKKMEKLLAKKNINSSTRNDSEDI